ncbi:competence type IV pilus minor pilin ComGF [Peribacillus psychrosaccharolyticus]|uniref:competence type IV pilus minor pilin ComGF n=1 Tax=Peribacillus psychrosaccharolyticus TaxID=1407 RepID=UPI0006853899|nr:competence type IV pilus minor pilin ComGF [Peribacillus psychrosaccharolyticus]MED3744515.1 competence type IV pilus minor pilin ComGF [Peribacillus psychrosaccharolyticus]
MTLQNKSGFTLVELLVSLSIFLAISSLILQMLTNVHTSLRTDVGINPKEWEIFLNQFKRQVYLSTDQKVSGNKLYLTVKNNEIVLFEQYGDKLRRRVNGTGHDVVLQNVSRLSMKKEGKVIVIEVTDKGGKLYTRSITPYINLVGVRQDG